MSLLGGLSRLRAAPPTVLGSDEAVQQGDEADEAWSTSELRLSPVLDGHQ